MSETLLSRFPEKASIWSNLNAKPASEVAPFSKTMGIWNCREGHTWKAVVSSVTGQDQSCAVCCGRQVTAGFNDLLSQRPDIVSEWDYEKNGSLLPEEVGFGTHLQVWWKCKKENHSWKTQVFARTNGGNGCPYCGGKKILAGYNDFESQRPELSAEWDYKKNMVNPSSIGIASHAMAWWLCPKNSHSYQSIVKSRSLRGHACPYCSNKKTLKDLMILLRYILIFFLNGIIRKIPFCLLK